ncbi:hypothetical protein BMETH_187_0 [methanotrophic bacterial endosymbiont of Bathymodiolus sp.]|nr:hypothetical protein BMETH_187_0 [methanotrophic bacterial endosymbiont of Bathymodiolus sp.]
MVPAVEILDQAAGESGLKETMLKKSFMAVNWKPLIIAWN